MGKDILFRWEDSPALQHHCGFCTKPLSHPGARGTCFGPHSEPCHRFHQAMFMRNRAHMCAMCNGADEAHHKRHQDMAERLRSIYERCGEAWAIIPSNEPERGRARRRGSVSLASGAPQATKKNKKEKRRLARAASRRRVITLREIKYIESVLHPASTVGDAEGPRNPEEIAEIEKHLRYNAQIYNTCSKRREMKEFALIPDVDVDFENEMDRILEILRVSELLKRNSKNRGLQGKELKHFEELVSAFKEHVVEDLLLLKKDEMEVRMRRASYLRFTNRASFDIVEERYAERDWRTGEKFSESPAVCSVSSGSITAIDEEGEEDDETAVDWRAEAGLSPPPPHGTDLRHLVGCHRRTGSGGKPEEFVSIRPSPTRVPIRPQGVSKRSSLQTRIVLSLEPKVSESSSTRSNSSDSVHEIIETPSKENAESLSWTKGELNQQTHKAKAEPTLPEINISLHSSGYDRITHPAVVQKKARKKQREADRKARRAAERVDKAVSETAVGEDATSLEASLGLVLDDENDKETVDDTTVRTGIYGKKGKARRKPAPRQPLLTPVRSDNPMPAVVGKATLVNIPSRKITIQPKVMYKVTQPVTSSMVSATTSGVSHSSTPASQKTTRVTKNGHDSDWNKYAYHLRLDGLSYPTEFDIDARLHQDNCPFGISKAIDCPCHAPYCSHSDPRNKQAYVVYPRAKVDYMGPFNAARAQKLFAFYETHPRTKGKTMVVDVNILKWLMDENLDVLDSTEALLGNMPRDLSYEFREYYAGGPTGRLMKQTETYRKLADLNDASENPVSKKELQDLYMEFTKYGGRRICYCEVPLPNDWQNDENLVACNFRHCRYELFHRDCIKSLGFDKVGTRYCPDCEIMMGRIARMMLEEIECMEKGTPLPNPTAAEFLAGDMKKMNEMIAAAKAGVFQMESEEEDGGEWVSEGEDKDGLVEEMGVAVQKMPKSPMDDVD
ncbi:hypothetical protein K458DRAFT_106687 [Lentithecium fluviatile CBS 122367]|uniref:Zinc finger PHD-type domain-containing protein n=1 Tax=Lentithecium fluviatile CBS 122367 TaxID=1168545 RepID=A0A6G1JJX7_9PLEO|nr:hypothetical protein K458DRAFT_106687 [Lentithecium fluviatile CBS 122367]